MVSLRSSVPQLLAGLVFVGSLLVAGGAGALGIRPGEILVSGTVRVAGPTGRFDEGVIVGIDPATGLQRVVASDALLRDPIGLAADGAGNVYALDQDRVIQIDGATGSQRLLSSGGLLIDAVDLTLTPSGDLLVLTNPDPRQLSSDIVRVRASDGAQILHVDMNAYTGRSNGIAARPDLEWAILSPQGCGGACLSVTLSDGDYFTAWLGFPTDLALAPDGRTVVSLYALGYLLGDEFAHLNGPALLLRDDGGRRVTWLDELPLGIGFTGDGELIAAFSDSVGRIDPASGAITTLSGGGLLGGMTVRDLTLVPTPSVPEPSAALVFAVGAALTVGRSRRRTRWPLGCRKRPGRGASTSPAFLR